MPTNLPAKKWTSDRPLQASMSPSRFSCAAIGAAWSDSLFSSGGPATIVQEPL